MGMPSACAGVGSRTVLAAHARVALLDAGDQVQVVRKLHAQRWSEPEGLSPAGGLREG